MMRSQILPYPRADSPCDRALRAIRAAGKPLDDTDLALVLDCSEKKVAELLVYPCREGYIKRSRHGLTFHYAVGSVAPYPPDEPAGVADGGDDATAADTSTVVGSATFLPLTHSAWPAVSAPPPPAEAPPAAIPRITDLKGWTMDDPSGPIAPPKATVSEPTGLIKDALPIEEAAGIADLGEGRKTARSRLVSVSERLADLLPELRAEAFECVPFIDGCVLMMVEGMPIVLSQEQTQRVLRAAKALEGVA
jgi:hypothetical protein